MIVKKKSQKRDIRVIGSHSIGSRFTIIGDVTKSAPISRHCSTNRTAIRIAVLRLSVSVCSFYFLLCTKFESIATVSNTRRRQLLGIARRIERSQSRNRCDLHFYKFYSTYQILFPTSQFAERKLESTCNAIYHAIIVLMNNKC